MGNPRFARIDGDCPRFANLGLLADERTDEVSEESSAKMGSRSSPRWGYRDKEQQESVFADYFANRPA